MLDQKFSKVRVARELKLGQGATVIVTSSTGVESTVDMAELAALDGIAAADLAKIDGITNGTAAAGKAVVLDASSAIDLVKFGAIGAADSALAIDGQAAAQGGEVNVKGGTSSTAGNAGGEAKLTGGTAGAQGAGGAITITSGAGGATSGVSGDVTVASGTTTAGSGSATGAVIVQSGAGAASAAAVAGGASGAVTIRSQAGGANTGGATGQVGGAGGAVSITGGAGGTTNSQGAHAGGAGSDISITAGAGGNASAGTGNGGEGGTIALIPGAGGTSAGGTAGVAGTVRLAGQLTRKVTVTAMTTTAAITVAALRGGMITANQGGAAAATYTTPTGAEIAAAMPADFTTGDSFDFSITNLSTNAAEDVTVAAGASGITLKGNMTVASNDAVGSIAAATFRVVCTGAATYDVYRVS